MTNIVADAAMDALLDHISNAATHLHVCSGSPTTRAAVIANSLGNVAIDETDFTKADGDVSGRKATLAQQSIGSASASGTAHCVAIIDGSNLLRVSDLSADQAVTLGNPITVAAHDHEVRDAA
jgi:hypothetical protein